MKVSRANLSRRAAILGIAGGVIGAPFILRTGLARAEQFSGKTIRVMTFADVAGQLAVEYLAKPFKAATGAEVIMDLTPSSSEMVAKVKASAANPQYDVVILIGVGCQELIDSDLVEPIEFDRLPNVAQLSGDMRQGLDGKGVNYLLNAAGMIYSTKAFSSPPKSWRVFWDERSAGKLALPAPSWIDATMTILMAARLAGGDANNPEPGFQLLKQLKDRVYIMSEAIPQMADLVRTEAVDLCGVFHPLYFASFLDKPEFNLGATIKIEEGHFVQSQYMVVPKGHPGDTEVIYAFLNHALDPVVQRDLASGQFAIPVNLKSELPAEILRHDYMLSPSQVMENTIPLHTKTLAKVRADWTKRYSQIFNT
jgi:putative spermidine/putrescine transport system substrate-binding protein